jgi:hypothetical protein
MIKEELGQARHHPRVEEARHDGQKQRDDHCWTDILVQDVWPPGALWCALVRSGAWPASAGVVLLIDITLPSSSRETAARIELVRAAAHTRLLTVSGAVPAG